MSLLGFLLLLLIAAVVGALGQALAGYSTGGCLVSIGVGFVGALLGSWLAEALDLPTIFTISIEGQPFPVVWAIIGSALFAAVLGLISRR